MEGEVGEAAGKGEVGVGVNDRLNQQTSKLIKMHGCLYPRLKTKGRLKDKGW